MSEHLCSVCRVFIPSISNLKISPSRYVTGFGGMRPTARQMPTFPDSETARLMPRKAALGLAMGPPDTSDKNDT